MMKFLGLILSGCCAIYSVAAETRDSLSYHVEATATAGKGDYAPLWFTANRYGLSSVEPNSAFLKAGLKYNKRMNHHWKMGTRQDIVIKFLEKKERHVFS